MRTPPDGKYDYDEITRMGAPDWMLHTLTMNPSYVFWGPYEDYMCDKNAGWRSPFFSDTWEEGKPSLDELNEVVNFYFEVERNNEKCEPCDGTGYNPATKEIADDWYDFAGTGRRWDKHITQHEVDALVNQGRLMDFTHTWKPEEGWKPKNPPYRPTADEVNNQTGYDAINRGICVQARAEREGVWGLCELCKGHGYVYTSPTCRLGLVLWVIFPRKGACRGWEIKSIKQEELPEVYKFLHEAAQRNADRFSKVPR